MAAPDGPWQKDRNASSWWENNPPFHIPVFVLTNHPRERLTLKGNNGFTFVADGIGGETRLLDNLNPMKLEKISVVDFPLATYLKYRIKK